uniref:Uncharacterized protein n=1 Tax=Anguilla anguilla TaxID=7936 RepID=A0A0E9PMV4_ANGAN
MHCGTDQRDSEVQTLTQYLHSAAIYINALQGEGEICLIFILF